MPKALVILAPGFEELEAVSAIDILRRGDVEVTVAGLEDGPVQGSRRTRIVPDAALDSVLHDDFDVVVLPGGLPGADHLEADPRVRDLLVRTAQAGRMVSAICAAPKVLGAAGLLDGKTATSYPGFLDGIDGVRSTGGAVERDGNVITSRAAGTATDFGLALVEALAGAERREQVEAGLLRS